MKLNKKSIVWMLPFVIIVVIAIPILLPYFHAGYFPTHDGEWAVVRLGDMFRELRDGQIPPRYSGNLNFGFGYPLFNFAYPLPYYLGIPLVLLHSGFVNSIKILFVVSFLLSLVFMYLASSKLWGNKIAGLVSAILYAYFPFRMVDLFVRGSLGETVASVFFPLILLCFIKIHAGRKKMVWALVGGISIGLLILAHNIMAILFMLILIPITAFFIREEKTNGKYYGLAFMYGILISAFFWLPALFEKHFIALSVTPIADRNLYFVSLPQLLSSPWGYAPPTDPGGFTYQIGSPQIVILVLSLISVVILGWKKKSFITKSSLLISCVTVILILLMFKLSSTVWQLPLLKEINYPWTLLLPIGFALSVLSGYLIKQSMVIKTVTILLSLLSVVLYMPWAKPQQYVNRGDGFYLTNEATTTSSDELMPLWVKEKPKQRKPKIEMLSSTGNINLAKNTSNYIEFTSTLASSSAIQINTIYYPGWNVSLDSKPINFSHDNPFGAIRVNVPYRTHTITARFTETPLRLLSDLTSLITFLGFPILLLLKNQ